MKSFLNFWYVAPFGKKGTQDDLSRKLRSRFARFTAYKITRVIGELSQSVFEHDFGPYLWYTLTVGRSVVWEIHVINKEQIKEKQKGFDIRRAA